MVRKVTKKIGDNTNGYVRRWFDENEQFEFRVDTKNRPFFARTHPKSFLGHVELLKTIGDTINTHTSRWLEEREKLIYTVEDEVIIKFHTKKGMQLRDETIELINRIKNEATGLVGLGDCYLANESCADLIYSKMLELNDFLFCDNANEL